ncbi:MAG: hypothetical protein EBZ48_03485 [Proteobacteria bacterium]|nr:hypothetical protein [Pseudomonadota bacterium]
MSARLDSHHLILPGPQSSRAPRDRQKPLKTGPFAGGPLQIQPSAGIEREIKLLLPLSTRLSRSLVNSKRSMQIDLAYFRPGEARVVIAQCIQQLDFLLVDGETFSSTELGQGRVIRGSLKSRCYNLELLLVRPGTSRGPVQKRLISISKKLARLLNRESLPLRRAKLVLKHAGPFIIAGKRYRQQEFISARLRQMRCGGTVLRFLDLKGKRHGSHHLHRAEVSLPLQPADFDSMVRRAHGGFVKKIRAFQPGMLTIRPMASLTAEIDILSAVGKKVRLQQRSRGRSLALRHGLSEFALAEVELPPGLSRRTLMRALQTGAHTLSILSGPAISLSFRSKNGWEVLGMKRLASRGFDRRAQSLLTDLLAPYQSMIRGRARKRMGSV